MYRYMQSSMFSFIAMHDYTLYKEKSGQKPIIQGSKHAIIICLTLVDHWLAFVRLPIPYYNGFQLSLYK
jgi:hypothetical protein